MKEFENSKASEMCIELGLKVYGLVKKFPEDERFVLTEEMMRALGEIPANIAMGCSGYSDEESLEYLSTARGVCARLDCFLEIAIAVGYFAKSDADESFKLIEQIMGEIDKLISAIPKQ